MAEQAGSHPARYTRGHVRSLLPLTVVRAKVWAVTGRTIAAIDFSPRYTSWGLSGLFAMVVEPVRDLLRNPEEKALRARVVALSETYGVRILFSRHLLDLDEQISQTLRDRVFYDDAASLIGFALEAKVALFGPSAGFADAFRVKSLPALPEIEAGDRVDAVMLAALERYLAKVPLEALAAQAGPDRGMALFSVLVDPNQPPEYVDALVGAFQATVCAMTLGAVVRHPDLAAPWLVHAIARRRHEGVLAYLRLLASIPGIDVPTDVIPLERRMNLPAIEKRHRHSVLWWNLKRAAGQVHVGDGREIAYQRLRLAADPADGEPVAPTEGLFEELLVVDPARLVAYLGDTALDPTLLTYAAEIAGRIPGEAPVRPLLALLQHEKAYVREGALYGLALHLDAPGVREALAATMEGDRSETVRAVAGEQLEWAARSADLAG